MEFKQTTDDLVDSLPEVGIAIFGLGRIGTIHLENLRKNPRAQILYCVEGSAERVTYIRKKYKVLEPETTYLQPSEQETVFKDIRVVAVVICTPTFAHEEIVMKSLESGKAVFCEKPLALDGKGIERCLDTSRKYNRSLLCAFNRRFDPGLRSLKNRIDSGEIGKVQVIKTCSRDHPRPPTDYLKISGGIFQDCAVHDIDYVCWILDEYPAKVSAFAHVYFDDIKQLGDQDTVCIMMKFPSGALATIDLSRHGVYGYDQRVEIFGSNGMLTNGDQRPTGVILHNTKGSTSVPIHGYFSERYRESYAAEIEHFLSVVQGTEKCEVDGNTILAIHRIANACHEAAQSGKIVLLNWKNQQKEIIAIDETCV